MVWGTRQWLMYLGAGCVSAGGMLLLISPNAQNSFPGVRLWGVLGLVVSGMISLQFALRRRDPPRRPVYAMGQEGLVVPNGAEVINLLTLSPEEQERILSDPNYEVVHPVMEETEAIGNEPANHPQVVDILVNALQQLQEVEPRPLRILAERRARDVALQPMLRLAAFADPPLRMDGMNHALDEIGHPEIEDQVAHEEVQQPHVDGEVADEGVEAVQVDMGGFNDAAEPVQADEQALEFANAEDAGDVDAVADASLEAESVAGVECEAKAFEADPVNAQPEDHENSGTDINQNLTS